jgi:hypothetical protein
VFVLTCTVVVLTCFVMWGCVYVCVCVGVLVICILVFTVSCVVCSVFFVLFHLCIFILICFVCIVVGLLPPGDNSIAVSSSSSSIFFSVALRPNAGHGLLILEVSRSHTTTHYNR